MSDDQHEVTTGEEWVDYGNAGGGWVPTVEVHPGARQGCPRCRP